MLPAMLSAPSESTAIVGEIGSDVLNGLSRRPRRLPCKYLYDTRGSQLFDRICKLREYYPTRTELAILRGAAGQIARAIGPRAILFEPGSGSSQKTRMLLDHLPDLSAYVPIDISHIYLQNSCRQLLQRYPLLAVQPVIGDFTRPLDLPSFEQYAARRAVFFPGSTIGNFAPLEARRLLGRLAQMAGSDGSLIIGIDLVKDRRVLHAAYNDAEGVTAAFNLNLLERINRELAGNFNLDAFRHLAIYNSSRRRIEMHLISLRAQTVQVSGKRFRFELGETICTEHSHKYTIPQFVALAARANLKLRHCWTDRRRWFAVMHFTVV
jgi:L-histidine Nalpha-methyltransferase